MCLVFSSLRDPAADQVDLVLAQMKIGLGRGHPLAGVFRRDALDHRAFLRLPRYDRATGERYLRNVEPQLGLAFVLIGAVADKAAIGQEWPNLEVVIDFPRLRRCGGARGQYEPKNADREQYDHGPSAATEGLPTSQGMSPHAVHGMSTLPAVDLSKFGMPVD